MNDSDLALAFENNLAEWWEAHTLATGGAADRNRGLFWALDRADGNSGMHRVRLSAENFDRVVNCCLDEACPHGSSIWAYVTNHATPTDAVDRFKAAGFLHSKRFEVYVHDLTGLAKVKLAKNAIVERMRDLDRFSKTVAHPYLGPVTTRSRCLAVGSGNQLIQERPGEYATYLLSVSGIPASIVTIFRTGDMAGVYDVGTVEAFRGRGYARQLLTHVLLDAKRAGASAAGLIAVAKAEPLYQRVGFRPLEGWMSLMYFSKTRMRQRAATV